jgi:hypothetical protein
MYKRGSPPMYFQNYLLPCLGSIQFHLFFSDPFLFASKQLKRIQAQAKFHSGMMIEDNYFCHSDLRTFSLLHHIASVTAGTPFVFDFSKSLQSPLDL